LVCFEKVLFVSETPKQSNIFCFEFLVTNRKPTKTD
jgi:hypothetical protein